MPSLTLARTLPLPDLQERLRFANVYFQRCHNQPYCYFQERSFYRRLRDGALPSYLVFAVMSTAARFMDESSSSTTLPGKGLAYTYARSSWAIILQNTMTSGDHVQLHLVQAVNLLAVIDFTSE